MSVRGIEVEKKHYLSRNSLVYLQAQGSNAVLHTLSPRNYFPATDILTFEEHLNISSTLDFNLTESPRRGNPDNKVQNYGSSQVKGIKGVSLESGISLKRSSDSNGHVEKKKGVKNKKPTFMDMSEEEDVDCEGLATKISLPSSVSHETVPEKAPWPISPIVTINRVADSVTPPPPIEYSSPSPLRTTQSKADNSYRDLGFEALSPAAPYARNGVMDEIVEAEVYDPHPGIQSIGNGVFKLPGKARPIFVTPAENDCTSCGKRKRSQWCPHLVSAGLRHNPPIIVGNNNKLYLCPLTKLEKMQKLSKAKSGRKKPRRNFDFKDENYNDLDEEPTTDSPDPFEALNAQVPINNL